MLNRRLQGAKETLKRQIASELRESIQSELQDLKMRILDYERRTVAAENAKDMMVAQCDQTETSNADLLAQLRVQASEMQNLKSAAAGLEQECIECQRKTDEALTQKQAADRYAGELAQTLQEMRERAESCQCEVQSLQLENSGLKTRLDGVSQEVREAMDRLDQERKVWMESVVATRVLYDKKAQELSASVEWEKQQSKRQIAEVRTRVNAAQETERKMLQMRNEYAVIERELRATREAITSLLDATARIGHFSAHLAEGKPVGDVGNGGRRDYEAVGKAWERLHNFLSRTSSTIFLDGEDEAKVARQSHAGKVGMEGRHFRGQASGFDVAHSPHDSLDGGEADVAFDVWNRDESDSVGDGDKAESMCDGAARSPHRKAREDAWSRGKKGAGLQERQGRRGTGVVSQRLRECMAVLTMKKCEAPIPSA